MSSSSYNLGKSSFTTTTVQETKTYAPTTSVTTTTTTIAPSIERVLLPTQIIEKPAAVHEEIRRELVEEIQPIINVEKLKTEVHQVTQPLFDREVRAVQIEQKTLATEILPEVLTSGRGLRAADDVSSTKMLATSAIVIEKPAQIFEVEKRQIIEEIQPVIYKETIIPQVIQETKPIFQKITEGAVYSHETLAARQVANPSLIAETYVTDRSVTAAVIEKQMLPVTHIQKAAAIHEEIINETVEEIQPVINIEKVKTEIHQVTQPLFDKEVRPIQMEKRLLATEILPEVLVEGQGLRSADDISTTTFLPTSSVTIEKPALVREVERTQIIEEIQPVIYKETVVPEVIRETKPVYQKIVEGTVFTQSTLASKQVANPSYIAEAYVTDRTIVAPMKSEVLLPTQIIEKPAALHESIRKELVEEIQPIVNVEKYQTEIHQVTQPLFDKEVRVPTIVRKTLATEVLPEVLVQGRGARTLDDVSTTSYKQSATVVIEKAAQVIEIERTQVIEEIQPVIYKETIVPSIIQETKPVFQRIVEGPVYVKETLPARSLSGSKFAYPTNFVSAAYTLEKKY